MHNIFCSHDVLCVLQVFYTFSFWLMFRQQLKERKDEQSLKAESLDEVKVVPRNLLVTVLENIIKVWSNLCFAVFPHLSSPCPSILDFPHDSRRKSAITSGSNADLRSERDAGEILDPLLLLHVLCRQLLWKGFYWQT